MAVVNIPAGQTAQWPAGAIQTVVHVYYPAGPDGWFNIRIPDNGNWVRHDIQVGHTITTQVNGQSGMIVNHCQQKIQAAYLGPGENALASVSDLEGWKESEAAD